MLFCFCIFLLVVLLCFESSCLISCCFSSCLLLLVVFGFCCFHILFFFDFNYLSKNISEKIGNCKTPKSENCTKKDILTRAVSTGVLTNSVFFSFLCFFKFCTFCLKHYKNRGFSQKKGTKKHKKNKKPSVKNWSKLALKTGPSMLRNKITSFSR